VWRSSNLLARGLTCAFVVRVGCSTCFPQCSGSSGRIDLYNSLTCGFVSEVRAQATSFEGRLEILDARMTLAAEASAAPPEALCAAILGSTFLENTARPRQP
jgi:hypothetical protein